ncbi:MAG: thiamine pyrophosphate-binding protein [Burkholderiaceae bacterium]
MSEHKPAGTHVYDQLARSFAQESVRTCFALLGDANMNWASRLAGLGCKMIYVRHEHCAVAAAMAYARKTGDVGLATVTCGPGVTQLMTALPAAVRARLPIVVFAGEAPLKSGWYNQAIDQAPFVVATGARYQSLHHIERMPVAVRDAFVLARRDRMPVVLGIPFDLQNRPWPGPEALPPTSRDVMPEVYPMPPHPESMAKAVALLNRSGKIIVMAGMGAVLAQAGQACQALADKLDALLVTTLPARGLFHDNPFCLGIAGSFSTEVGLECLAQADLVVLVGGSQAFHAGGGGQLWPKAQVLQIDTDPVGVAQGQTVGQHHLRCDALLGVKALSESVQSREDGWRSDALAKRIRTAPSDSHVYEPEPGLHDPREVIAALEAALPADWEMVNSSGHCSGFAAHMPSRPQDLFLTIREFGAIGNGTSFAMGVAAARPDRTVVLFDGDGSLLMHIQELETICRHGMKVLIIVLNDGAYGSEIHKLRSEGMPADGAVFGRPDFAHIARSFGLGGHQVTDLNELPEMVNNFANQSLAAVWDFPISDRVVTPIVRKAHPQRS